MFSQALWESCEFWCCCCSICNRMRLHHKQSFNPHMSAVSLPPGKLLHQSLLSYLKMERKKKWLKDNNTQLFNIKLCLYLLAPLFVDYTKMLREDIMVNFKLTHYITQSSSAVSFSTVHGFFICGSVLKFQRNIHASQIWRNFFWSFHTEKLI